MNRGSATKPKVALALGQIAEQLDLVCEIHLLTRFAIP
jgi:hypothetical protein